MSSGSHVWSKGLQLITDGNTAGSPAFASWRSIAAGTYTGSWRCALGTAVGTYTSSQLLSACTEITGTNYAQYGAGPMATNSVAIDGTLATHVEYVSSGSPQWTSASFTADYAIIIASLGTTSSPVLCNFDFAGDKTVTAGTFTLTFGTDSVTANSVFNLVIS